MGLLGDRTSNVDPFWVFITVFGGILWFGFWLNQLKKTEQKQAERKAKAVIPPGESWDCGKLLSDYATFLSTHQHCLNEINPTSMLPHPRERLQAALVATITRKQGDPETAKAYEDVLYLLVHFQDPARIHQGNRKIPESFVPALFALRGGNPQALNDLIISLRPGPQGPLCDPLHLSMLGEFYATYQVAEAIRQRTLAVPTPA
jgi:hypothetical protein